MTMTRIPSGRGWMIGAMLVGVVAIAGLVAWGVTPWVATFAGIAPVLLAAACAIPCLLPLVLIRRGGRDPGASGGRRQAPADASRLPRMPPIRPDAAPRATAGDRLGCRV
jgi:hypothetical protein